MFPGGVCNESQGKAGTTGIPAGDGFHTWSIRIDRSSNDWTQEVIEWSIDGNAYHTLRGAELGDQGVWATLAHSPLFIILNLAVGGDWYVTFSGASTVGWLTNLDDPGPALPTTRRRTATVA